MPRITINPIDLLDATDSPTDTWHETELRNLGVTRKSFVRMQKVSWRWRESALKHGIRLPNIDAGEVYHMIVLRQLHKKLFTGRRARADRNFKKAWSMRQLWIIMLRMKLQINMSMF